MFNINFNVFCYDNNRIYPLYDSQQNNEQVLNVLLISDEKKSHYVFIKDFDRMMYSLTGTKNQHKKFYCMHYLQKFTTEEILNKRKEKSLLINGTQKSIFESGVIKFKNFDKQIPIPFRNYADIEFFNKKANFKKGNNTTFYSKHVPNSIDARLVCSDNTCNLPIKLFFGSDCINTSSQWFFEIKKHCNNIIKNHFNKKLIMTKADEENYNNTNTCWIYTAEITENKVRDHCHITGKFRGVPHKKCNSLLRIPKQLPVIFHNLEG